MPLDNKFLLTPVLVFFNFLKQNVDKSTKRRIIVVDKSTRGDLYGRSFSDIYFINQ